jgi:hypothetical protein
MERNKKIVLSATVLILISIPTLFLVQKKSETRIPTRDQIYANLTDEGNFNYKSYFLTLVGP